MFSLESSVIVPGLVIRTRFPSRTSWIPNVISWVKNDTFKIPLVDEYLSEDLINEDMLIIEFFDDDCIYKIEGKILDMDMVNAQTISIRIANFFIQENERKSKRFYANLGANVRTKDDDSTHAAIINNISSTGICFVSKTTYCVDDEISIDVLGLDKKIISFKGKVVRARQVATGNEHAIKLELDEAAAENILEIINSLEQRAKQQQEDSSKSYLNANILLVEGSNLIRTIVKHTIHDIGASRVFEAKNSTETTHLIKTLKPDIVCMSYIIYEVEDSDILDELYTSNPDVKIVFLSSTPKSEIDPNLLIRYKIDYISKSSNYDSLISTIKNYKVS